MNHKTNENSHPALLWEPTREAALGQLQAFVPHAGHDYATQRNYDIAPDITATSTHFNQENRNPSSGHSVSRLSPWVRHRLITEQEILYAVLAQHNFQSSEKFIQEVFWRGYFKGWLEHRKSVWHDYKKHVEQLAGQLETGTDAIADNLRDRYHKAISGCTGITCFDSWCEQLKNTGYLHNHARMWFASIWVYTLKLPWQLGADFFYRNLLDGDPASNTCSWRWVCGLHTKGKTYLAHADNIEKFTAGRFGPTTGLATVAQPFDMDLIAVEAVHFDNLSEERLETITTSRYGLLLTEENCHIDAFSELTQAESQDYNSGEETASGKPRALLGLSLTDKRSLLPVSEQVHNFSSAIVNNAIANLERTFDCESRLIENPDTCDSLLDWANNHQLEYIVTPRAPIGPTCDWLDNLEQQLIPKNIKLVRLENSYDKQVWPHATKGFFALKKKIPNILETLALGQPG